MPGYSKMTPVIVADAGYPGNGVAARFLRESLAIEPELVRLVYDAIGGQPSHVGQISRSARGEAVYENCRD